MSKKGMRAVMPETAAWIDSLREAFGADAIDAQIRKSMRGEPTFFASENGHVIGIRLVPPEEEVVRQAEEDRIRQEVQAEREAWKRGGRAAVAELWRSK
ncbi:MAG: hypothetical protein WBG17_05170 [Burkholderiaceae bacterium]